MSIKLKDIVIDNDPANYTPSTQLIQAVEIAYSLKRPLLLSGEPGTGKTEFARYVANELQSKGFHREPLLFNTKSSSIAQDLFYHYDAVGHFGSANLSNGNPMAQERSAEDFIQLKALGLAFANAIGRSRLQVSTNIKDKGPVSDEPTGSVVLIDEIDKASRDFPNDLLNEIEQYQFEIREINKMISLDEEQRKRILIIMTSNFEKNLPEAFLRRCIYFHIEFPGAEQLKNIVVKRLNLGDDELQGIVQHIKDFYIIRNDTAVQKKPSTSELIDWIRVVRNGSSFGKVLFDENKKVIKASSLLNYLPILLKKKEDLLMFTE